MTPTRKNIPRREVLKILGASAAGAWIAEPFLRAADHEVRIAGKLANVSTRVLSKRTIRITIAEQVKGAATRVADDGALVASGNFPEHGALATSAQAHAVSCRTALEVRIALQDPAGDPRGKQRWARHASSDN